MFLSCFRDGASLVSFCQEKAFKTYAADDMSLGHMIVLLQYDWPRYEDLFGDCLNKIRKQGSFTYNIFFNYVISILVGHNGNLRHVSKILKIVVDSFQSHNIFSTYISNTLSLCHLNVV